MIQNSKSLLSLLHQPATRTKASIDALKQNSDFLREKSLYRYYISKNQPRKSINKTEESLGAFHA